MSAISKKLRTWADPATGREGVTYWCQGCKSSHSICTKGGAPGQAWQWNGDAERPVFSPSVLARSGHYATGHKPGDSCWCTYKAEHPEDPDSFECVVCHTFIGCNGAQPGEVIFLSDCTHALAGTVQPFPDLPEYMQ